MTFSEAMQMLGTKLQGKYGHLGFKYKKSDKTLTRHSKNYTYMIAFSSFGGNTKDKDSTPLSAVTGSFFIPAANMAAGMSRRAL